MKLRCIQTWKIFNFIFHLEFYCLSIINDWQKATFSTFTLKDCYENNWNYMLSIYMLTRKLEYSGRYTSPILVKLNTLNNLTTKQYTMAFLFFTIQFNLIVLSVETIQQYHHRYFQDQKFLHIIICPKGVRDT